MHEFTAGILSSLLLRIDLEYKGPKNGLRCYISCQLYMKSLWRNRLARSTVNRKVGGSSPPRDDHVF